MSSLYSSPLRVYLLLGFLSLVGIFCGLTLPISLFPNSSRPVVQVSIPLGDVTARDFLNSYGGNLEATIAAISTEKVQVEKIDASYSKNEVFYKITFPWETPANEALKEVQNIVYQTTATMPEEVRRGTYVGNYLENNGFFAASFYSKKRDLDDLYKILDPVFTGDLKKIQDASSADLWNPAEKEVQVELKANNLTQYQLLPIDVTRALVGAMENYQAGSVDSSGKKLQIIVRSSALKIEDIAKILVPTPSGHSVHINDIAKIDYTVPVEKSRVIRTSGSVSIILYANPKAGGNIKKMSEDILSLIDAKKSALPADIEYKILVDPSEFIRSSVNNVLHEVLIAAGLAVVILFLFIGSFKNVVTAAIEIPMSIVLAFIFMKLFNMNLNLISLGGLALSAGMNVDGSVVVMENIFRHFEKAKGQLTSEQKLQILLKAVNEVKLPIIASTIASIVVFAPLIFTKGLSSAILGDLAKAVIFSHGLSAVVALILVPTVRLQMMRSEAHFHVHSPLEKYFVRLEKLYEKTLNIFLNQFRLRLFVYAGSLLSLILLVVLVIPVLPKEVIGTPDTDWVILGQNSQGNTFIRQMETQSEETEARILNLLGDKVLYTFVQVQRPNSCFLMLRLRNKKDMSEVMKTLENEFANTPVTQYFVDQWNPSELPLPDPENLLISIRGRDTQNMFTASKELFDTIQEKQLYKRFRSEPDVTNTEVVSIYPRLDLWPEISKSGSRITPADLGDYARVITDGRPVVYMSINGVLTRVVLRYPPQTIRSVEELEALPINISGKLIPLKAVAQIKTEPSLPTISRIDLQEQYSLHGRLKKEEKSQSKKILAQVKTIVDEWKQKSKLASSVSVLFDDPEIELENAIHQLMIALGISMLLILLTMILQLGHVVNSLLVFMAVPLGFIGVLVSLFVFKSTLSLNSLLGVILLNGIAVANSIILVDFLNRLVEEGMSPHEAALEAARTRLRPILMTSLTTTLGMLPIAFGFGEGGRILQPLGVAVSGGLGVSMLLTLFVVPALQVSYLNFQNRRKQLK